MALGREKDVADGWTLVEIADLVQKQPAHDVERAEARADVSRPRSRDHVEHIDPGERGEELRLRPRWQRSLQHAPEFGNGDAHQLVAGYLIELLFAHCASYAI